MERLTFRLKVVTPLFLSGADQQIAELRPPSIRGALRFWFRAMMGGVVVGDWQKVKRLEALAFGSTEQGSSWQVKVGESTLKLLHAQETVGPLDEGILYLGFNLFRRGRRTPGKPAEPDTLERACFWPSEGKDCQLQLVFRSSDQLGQQVVLGALWLLIHCGGLGARMRRGFGGLSVLQAPRESIFQWNWPQQGSCDYFQNHLKQIAEIYKQLAQAQGISADAQAIFTRSANMPAFSCFARWQGLVLHPRNSTWKDWEEALAALGRVLRDFRKDPHAPSRFGATYDYTVVAPFLDGNLSPRSGPADLRYDSFGLPLQYRSASRTTQAQKQAEALQKGLSEEEARKRARRLQVRAILQAERRVQGSQETLDRRASPLMVRPICFQDQTYGGLLLFFEAEFLPQGAQEVLQPIDAGWPPFRQKPQPIPIQLANLQVVSDFLDAVKQKSDYTVEEL